MLISDDITYRELARARSARDMVIVTWAHEETARRPSYRLIAEAAGLARRWKG